MEDLGVKKFKKHWCGSFQWIIKYLMFCLKLMTEILFGIRVLKYYNWEEHFTQKIAEARKKELHHLKVLKYLDAVCVYTWAALPVVISILTFITYVMLGNNLTAAKVCRSHFKRSISVYHRLECFLKREQSLL